MNKIKLLTSLLVCLSIIFCGCDDYLDKTPDDKVNEKEVFTSYDKVEKLVTDLYEGCKTANRPLLYFNHFGHRPAIGQQPCRDSHPAGR